MNRNTAHAHPSGEGEASDGVRDLLRFHRNIREHMSELEELVAMGKDTGWVAARLTGFFSGPLLWHDNDEEVLLVPRLRAVLDANAASVLGVIADDHAIIESHLERLCPMLESVARGGAVSLELKNTVKQLATLLNDHLRREEDVLFGLARAHLDDDSRAQLAAELRRVRSARASSTPSST